MIRYIIIILTAITVASCGKTEIKEPLEYKGPSSEVENIELYYGEQDQVKVKMVAALFYEYQNGDREFPKGVHMEFYDELGALESTLRADEAYFFKEQNQWRGRGNVEVKNIRKNEQLNTEELFWKPAEKKILTEKFVTIRQQGNVIYGEGLDAKEDLSDYVITKPHGELEIDE
jgi:LPS export ABC transporter protein LptC